MADAAAGHDRSPILGNGIADDEAPTRRIRRYTRAEMEDLMPREAEHQYQWWSSIYQNFDPTVAREYDGLCTLAQAQQHKRCDGPNQRSRWKKQPTEGVSVVPRFQPKPPCPTSMTDATGHNRSPILGNGIADDEAPTRKIRRYTRAEMEDLMPCEAEHQYQWWTSIYQNFDPTVAREYDGLCTLAQAQQHKQCDGSNQRSHWKKQPTEVKPIADSGKRTKECDKLSDECNSVISQESFNEENEVEDDNDCIMRPAFLVEGEPDFDFGPPEDGLEYLRRVRWEATQLPRVKVVKFDVNKCKEQTPYMPKISEIAKCPPDLLPVKEWVDAFLPDFANLRQAFSQMERFREEPNHSSTATTLKSSTASEASQLNDLPYVSTLLAMSPLARANMLRKRISDLENESTLSRSCGSWIFALCVAVDAPLNADMSATMRSLLRKCSSLLASRSDPSDDEVAMLNILVVIAGKYFGQLEKASM